MIYPLLKRDAKSSESDNNRNLETAASMIRIFMFCFYRYDQIVRGFLSGCNDRKQERSVRNLEISANNRDGNRRKKQKKAGKTKIKSLTETIQVRYLNQAVF